MGEKGRLFEEMIIVSEQKRSEGNKGDHARDKLVCPYIIGIFMSDQDRRKYNRHGRNRNV